MKERIIDIPDNIDILKDPKFIRSNFKPDEIKNSLFLVLKAKDNSTKLKVLYPNEKEKRFNGFDKNNIDLFLKSVLKINDTEKNKLLEEIINEINFKSFDEFEFIDFVKWNYKQYLIKKFTEKLLQAKFWNNIYEVKKIFYYSFEGDSKSIIREKFNLINIKIAELLLKFFKSDIIDSFNIFPIEFSRKLIKSNFIVKYINVFSEKLSEKPTLQAIDIINLFPLFKKFFYERLLEEWWDKNLAKNLSDLLNKKIFYRFFTYFLLKQVTLNKNLLRKILNFFTEERIIYIKKNKYKFIKSKLFNQSYLSKVYPDISTTIKKYYELIDEISLLEKKIQNLRQKKEKLERKLKEILNKINKIEQENKKLWTKLRKVNYFLRTNNFPELDKKEKKWLMQSIGEILSLKILQNKDSDIKEYSNIRKDLLKELTKNSANKIKFMSEKLKIIAELKEINIESYELKLEQAKQDFSNYKEKYKELYYEVYNILLSWIKKVE